LELIVFTRYLYNSVVVSNAVEENPQEKILALAEKLEKGAPTKPTDFEKTAGKRSANG
jgi:hypothetical protein